ncbi:MAG: hypothetical protein GXY52_10965 [Chloroflexi bacterium]|nr:hypothetical protein [Chloroflexota bacterium]
MQADYTAYRTRSPITIDGRLDERAWALAPRTPRFVDLANGDLALFDTTAAVLWDDTALYIGFWLEEPFPYATLTERDDMVCRENDIEVFFDGGDCYYEFELNALNTIYEVFFIWQDAYRRGSRFDVPEFDLTARKAVSFGGNDDRSGPTFWRGSHPRGVRWAFLDWDFPGLETAVHVDGTLNDRKTLSKGWCAELKFPWAGMTWLANGRALPPNDGDIWPIMLARFENYFMSGVQVPGQAGWALTSHGVMDSHRPERFSRIRMDARYVEDLAPR